MSSITSYNSDGDSRTSWTSMLEELLIRAQAAREARLRIINFNNLWSSRGREKYKFFCSKSKSGPCQGQGQDRVRKKLEECNNNNNPNDNSSIGQHEQSSIESASSLYQPSVKIHNESVQVPRNFGQSRGPPISNHQRASIQTPVVSRQGSSKSEISGQTPSARSKIPLSRKASVQIAPAQSQAPLPSQLLAPSIAPSLAPSIALSLASLPAPSLVPLPAPLPAPSQVSVQKVAAASSAPIFPASSSNLNIHRTISRHNPVTKSRSRLALHKPREHHSQEIKAEKSRGGSVELPPKPLLCSCAPPYASACECLCPCPKPCHACFKKRNYLPAQHLNHPFHCNSKEQGPSLISNHFWRSLYPASPWSVCPLTTDGLSVKLREYNCNVVSRKKTENFVPVGWPKPKVKYSGDAQVRSSETIMPKRVKAKVFNAERNLAYTEPPTRVPSTQRLDLISIRSFTNSNLDTPKVGHRPVSRPYSKSTTFRKVRIKSTKSSNRHRSQPLEGVLSLLRIPSRDDDGGLHTSTTSAAALTSAAFGQRPRAAASRNVPPELPQKTQSTASYNNNKDKYSKKGSRHSLAYKSSIQNGQQINKLNSNKRVSESEAVVVDTDRSILDAEFMKIQQSHRVPIIWIFGYTQLSVAEVKRRVVNQIAEKNNYYIMDLDYEFKRLGSFKKLINNNKQLTAQVMTRAHRLLSRISSSNYLLRPHEICELLKLAILIIHTGDVPPKGYIIDSFPLDLDEATSFEKMIWPSTLGLYFIGGDFVEIKNVPPAVKSPKYYLRKSDYYERNVEEAVDAFGHNSIKILYAEQMRKQNVFKDFMSYFEHRLSAQIQIINMGLKPN